LHLGRPQALSPLFRVSRAVTQAVVRGEEVETMDVFLPFIFLLLDFIAIMQMDYLIFIL
jgi:hypothetical protein